ncbi:MAG: hypothetical protein ACTHJK_02280 [Sphingomicrobium sp.]
MTYDTSVGNGVDADGFASLPLRSGASRYFVNSSTGSDGNSCAAAKSPTTPKATLSAGVACITNGEGDQVLLAEGTSYAEPMPYIGTASKDGYSPVYPTVISSYNPADPTNSAEYGRGDQRGDRPVITAAAKTNIANQGPNYFAIKGLDFNPGNVSNALLAFTADGTVPHSINYVLLENNILRYTGISIDNGGGGAWPGNHVVIRNNSLYSMWSSSDAVHIGGVYVAGVNGPTLEDNVFYHCGWNEAVARNTAANTGGPTVFNHSYYLQTSTTNAIVRRNLSMEGAGDGGISRGDSIVTENLYIDNPAALGLGGGPNYGTDRPNGVSFEASYNAIIGSDGVNNTTDLLSWGINTTNGIAGSRVHNNLMVWAKAMTGLNNSGFSNNAAFNQPSYAQYDHNLIWNWVSQTNQAYSYYASCGNFPAQCHTTYDYNNWDGLPQGTNTNSASTSFPNPYTAAQLYAALGFADRTAFINYAINHPEAHIQRTARSLLFTGYGMQ